MHAFPETGLYWHRSVMTDKVLRFSYLVLTQIYGKTPALLGFPHNWRRRGALGESQIVT